MTMTVSETERYLGIAEVADETGLSQGTLRWYEREGLSPRIARGSDGRRRYTAREVDLLRSVVRLRRTGMPTREVRRFSRLAVEGAATHGQRMALLAEHRERILAHVSELQGDLAALDTKIEHYRSLIDQGLDCAGAPVDANTAVRQRSTVVE